MTTTDAALTLPIGSRVLRSLTESQRALLASRCERIEVADGVEVVREGGEGDSLYFVLSGRLQVQRGGMSLAELGDGDVFGELGALGESRRAATVRCLGTVVLARLERQEVAAIAHSHPALMGKLYGEVVRSLGDRLVDMTDNLARMLQERARPLRAEVEVRLPGGTRRVPSATPIWRLLGLTGNGDAAIAATHNGKAVSLNRPVYAGATIEPMNRDSWEGRAVYRHSVDLLLLEAARELAPELRPAIGPSLGFAHIVEHLPLESGFVRALEARMRHIVAEARPLRRERWTVEEAREQLLAQGWKRAARLLRTWRDSLVPLASYGQLYAIEIDPFAYTTAALTSFGLTVQGGDLLLYFGDEPLRSDQLVQAAQPGRLARKHTRWLKQLDIDCVGAFNDHCIAGEVGQIIRVSEGFHEKRISQIADAIADADRPIRAICIAGPSSAGKSTFIKRLTVQLQVNGMTPHGLGLDDYYVDRERTVRDEHGEYDFEAFEAIDTQLLGHDLRGLMAGEATRLAVYDFVTGKSTPGGGDELQLDPGHVLLLEGIHALNPRLPLRESDGVFRIFINPMTSLPLDDVHRVSVSDIRLLRRIVRDRQKRAISAAENIRRWPSVRRGEFKHIFPHQPRADAVFNSSLLYEAAVLRVYADRYLLEVPEDHPSFTVAFRLRRLIDKFVPIYPDHVPPTSLLREFIG